MHHSLRVAMKKKNIICIIVLALVGLAMAGMATVLQHSTLIVWWKPVLICLTLSCALGLPLKRLVGTLLNIKSNVTNYIIGSIFALAVTTGAFYSINYYYSDASTEEKCKARIVGKYSRERHRSRRVGRGHYVRGEKYMVYYMVIELPDGRQKEASITAGEYARTKVGQNIELSVETGFFEIPVIKDLSQSIQNRKQQIN